MIKIKCSRKEKELIREVIDIQLDNLSKIVTGECPVDLKLFCIQNEIDPQELRVMTIKNMMRFERVKRNPNTLFFLDSDNLSIFRHILFNLAKKNNKKAKINIWRKIFQYDRTIEFYNPN